MSALQIHLRKDLLQRAEKQAVEAGYKDVVEYVEAIVEAGISDDELEIDDELESLLIQRLDSGGPSIRVTPEFIQQMKDEVRQRREQ